jgi:gamma-glutamyltranspeptidase / glutathione hydrolase
MNRPVEATRATAGDGGGVGIVVSPHHMASAAGTEILRSGGNAVDAAIAVDAMLAVVLPDTCGPGGDLFALVHTPGSARPATLNASGRAGTGVTADDLRDMGHGEIPYRSPWSITVPGCVDGWEALLDRFGSLRLGTILAPAIATARNGFEVSTELGGTLERIADLVAGQGSASPLYPDGPAAPGDTITRPALADTLEAIAEGGRAAFYGGRVGDGIIVAAGGAVTPDDLEVLQADWVEPASLDIFGRTAWTIPPNSQGYLTLATLSIFASLDPPQDPNDPLYAHLLVEAYRSVAWERADTVCDPSTAPLSVAGLLDAARLSERARRIHHDRTTRWPMPREAPGGTAYMAVLDGSGMGISLIQSNFAGIGSGLSAGSTGVWLHNRGAGFNLIQGHPNEYGPRKRPLHTLSPTLWTRGDDLDLLLGTRGGDQQPQFLAQIGAHHYHAGLCIDDAQALPRWTMEQPTPGTDGVLRMESRHADATVSGLESLGHTIEISGAYEPSWGPVSLIDATDTPRGAADPRVSTSTALTTEA